MAEMPAWKARLFTPLHSLVTLALFVEVAALCGLALYPAAWLWLRAAERLPPSGELRLLALCAAAVAGYFVFGLALILILPAARFLLFAPGSPRGRFAYFSFNAWRWASFNALTLILRFTFIHWIRATPFLPLYHRLMGMKVGARVQFNTAVVADQNLIAVGDDTVVGGDVTLVAHAAESGALVTSPVRIGRRVTLGIMAVVLPGCDIGDDAVIAAGAVLPKGTVVGAGEIWGGVPARRIGRRGQLSQ